MDRENSFRVIQGLELVYLDNSCSDEELNQLFDALKQLLEDVDAEIKSRKSSYNLRRRPFSLGTNSHLSKRRKASHHSDTESIINCLSGVASSPRSVQLINEETESMPGIEHGITPPASQGEIAPTTPFLQSKSPSQPEVSSLESPSVRGLSMDGDSSDSLFVSEAGSVAEQPDLMIDDVQASVASILGTKEPNDTPNLLELDGTSTPQSDPVVDSPRLPTLSQTAADDLSFLFHENEKDHDSIQQRHEDSAYENLHFEEAFDSILDCEHNGVDELEDEFLDEIACGYHNEGLSNFHDQENTNIAAGQPSDEIPVDNSYQGTHHEMLTDQARYEEMVQLISLAKNPGFCLPHECAHPAPFDVEYQKVLDPLLKGEILSMRLIHGVLFALLPREILIIEWPDSSDRWDLERELSIALEATNPESTEGSSSPETSKVSRYITIIDIAGAPLLVLADGFLSKFVVIGSQRQYEEIDLDPFLARHPFWEKNHIDSANMSPGVDATLMSVHLTESYFNKQSISETPDQVALQLRFLRALLTPLQTDIVLEQLGIPSQNFPSRRFEIRESVSRPEFLEDGIDTLDLHGQATELARSQRLDNEGKYKKRLRIFQCIIETGHPDILDSLKVGLAPAPEAVQGLDQSVIKLLRIHSYLANHSNDSQLAIARSRYVKFCYFQTFRLAVDDLTKRKKKSRTELHRIREHKKTMSYSQGLTKPPPTSVTDSIERDYSILTEEERELQADRVIKKAISKGIRASFGGGDLAKIENCVTLYIREGKIMNLILEGAQYLNPGLFLLFPGEGSGSPSLQFDSIELQEKTRRSLSNPIKSADIDKLTEDEAKYFGSYLRILRPELLQPFPEGALALLSGSASHTYGAQKSLDSQDPFQFLYTLGA